MCPSSTTSSNPRESRADGLVIVNAGRRAPSAIAWIVITFFLTIIVGTGIIDSIFPVPLPRLTGLERKLEEQRIQNARIVDGSKARLIEHHQRLRSRIRAMVSPEYSFALHRWLHEVKPSVIYGKDGWLYLRSRVLPKQQISQRALVRIADDISHVSQLCAQAGSRFILLPIPRKAVLCAAYLPEWVHADLSIDSVFISLLQERGIHTVNMMEFIRADGNTPPYYKRGSHWTQPTQLTTAKVVCEVSGILSRAEERITEIVPLGERSEEFGVLGYAGIATNRRIENILKATTSPKYKVQRKTAGPGSLPNTYEDRSVFLFGTSFSAGSFSTFIQHFSRYSITNMAHRGTNTFRHFSAFLRNMRSSSETGVLPDIIIIEFPIHQLFEPLQKEFSELHALLQPEDVPPLPYSNITITPEFTSGHDIYPTPIPAATLDSIPPQYSADGSLSILVKGALSGGNATLVARSQNGTSRVRWKQGVKKIFIPIIGKTPVNHVTVSIRSLRNQEGIVHARIDDILLFQSEKRSRLIRHIEPTDTLVHQNIRRN